MSGCSGEPVYKSKTESYHCEEHKIAFYCEVCGIAVWRDGDEHDESKCDDTGEKWYCPDCDLTQDDFTNRMCENNKCKIEFDVSEPHFYDEEEGVCYCNESCYNRHMESERY